MQKSYGASNQNTMLAIAATLVMFSYICQVV